VYDGGVSRYIPLPASGVSGVSEPTTGGRGAAIRIPYLELDGSARPQAPSTRSEAKALTAMVPGHYAAIYRAIPLHYDGQKLTVALVNPHDSLALSRLQEGAGCPLQAAPLDAAAFSRYYAALYQPPATGAAAAKPQRTWWWLGLTATVGIWMLLITGALSLAVALPLLCITGVFTLLSWFLAEDD
jgi:hypothetical protein